MKNQASEYNDFLPFNDPVHFKHGETEQLIKVELVQPEQKIEGVDEKTKKEDEKDASKSKDDGEEEEEDQKLVF